MSTHTIAFRDITKLHYAFDEDKLPDPMECFQDENYDDCARVSFLYTRTTMHILIDQSFLWAVQPLDPPLGELDAATRIALRVQPIRTIAKSKLKILYDQQRRRDGLLLTIERRPDAEWHSEVLRPLKQRLLELVA